TDLTAKRLGLLHELVPKAAAVGVLLDTNVAEVEIELKDAEAAGRAIGRQVVVVKAASEVDFTAAFSTIIKAGAGALLVGGGPFYLSKRRELAALAIRTGQPPSYLTAQSPEAGGLMSYGPSQTDAYRRAGIYVGRILRGEKPSDLPIEFPTKFELVIN